MDCCIINGHGLVESEVKNIVAEDWCKNIKKAEFSKQWQYVNCGLYCQPWYM